MNIMMLFVCAMILATNAFIQTGRTKESFSLTGEEQELVVNGDDLKTKPIGKDAVNIGKLFLLVLATLLIVDIILFNKLCFII